MHAAPKLNAYTGDPYRSRVDAAPNIVARDEPVVYGDPAQARATGLSDTQIAHYAKYGYVMLENFFSRKEVDALLRAARACAADPAVDPAHVIREPGGDAVRSVFYIHQTQAIFRAVMEDRRLLTVARHFLGGDVYAHQSRVNFKPGFRGKEFYWHSDFETWHSEDGMPAMRALSCSVSLTDNHAENGPLMVMPGSHRYFVSCVGKTPENHFEQSLRRQEYGVPDDASLAQLCAAHGIHTPVGKAGSVTFFDCNIMHGSNSNITPYARTNLFMVYNSVENRLVAPYGGTPPRPEYIAARGKEVPLKAESPDYTALARHLGK